MARPRNSVLDVFRQQARRLLPLLFVGLVSLQAQASCAMAGDLETARADASWVMHQHAGDQGADLGEHAGHGMDHGVDAASTGDSCPGCTSHADDCAGDTCLQVLTDSPDGTVAKTELEHQALAVMPAALSVMEPIARQATGMVPRTEFITERPPRLRFVRFLE